MTDQQTIAEISAKLAATEADNCRMREALKAMFNPAHVDGCLWLADNRMPCQCGSRERVNAWRDEGRAAASASGECVHQAEVKRLTEELRKRN